jgi:hypothetical protein
VVRKRSQEERQRLPHFKIGEAALSRTSHWRSQTIPSLCRDGTTLALLPVTENEQASDTNRKLKIEFGPRIERQEGPGRVCHAPCPTMSPLKSTGWPLLWWGTSIFSASPDLISICSTFSIWGKHVDSANRGLADYDRQQPGIQSWPMGQSGASTATLSGGSTWLVLGSHRQVTTDWATTPANLVLFRFGIAAATCSFPPLCMAQAGERW